MDDEKVLVVINLNYRDIPPTILPYADKFDRNSWGLDKIMNAKSKSPDENPDITKKTIGIDDFGRATETITETKHKDKKKEVNVI